MDLNKICHQRIINVGLLNQSVSINQLVRQLVNLSITQSISENPVIFPTKESTTVIKPKVCWGWADIGLRVDVGNYAGET